MGASMTGTGKHILFLTDNFPPEVNAPASRTFEHCREWVRAGYTVTVITSAPNFPEGRLHPGYRNHLWDPQTIEGIRVVRVWTYIAPNAGFARRVIDFLSYMISATIAALFVRRANVVIGTSPHLFVACAAMIVASLKRIPFVFELRDLWPESIRAVGAMKRGRVFALLERLELFLYHRATLIVALTHSFKSNLIARGVPGSKIAIITNGADLAQMKRGPYPDHLARALGVEGAFVAGYVGTIGAAHGLQTILDAADIIARQYEDADIRILFIGEGAERAKLGAEAAARGLGLVRFIDPVDKAGVAEYWRLLDVAIIHLRDDPLFATVIPSKTFDAMAVGTPILHGVRGESAEIVASSGAGILFEPGNGQELARLIIALKRNPDRLAELSRSGLQAAPRFDRKRLAQQMLGVIEEVLAPARTHRPSA